MRLRRRTWNIQEDAKLTSDVTNPMITQIQQALANLGPKAITPSGPNMLTVKPRKWGG